jgi:large subunit ribosomal protein L16
MFLQPKNFKKLKKTRKGKIRKLEFKSNTLKFGTIGLKASTSGIITARQIEAARQAITRKTKRKGKIWIRIFPDLPITSKPREARMGKGKGSISLWAAKIIGGSVLFEICGIKENVASVALKLGGNKLPIKTLVFK